MSYKFRLYPIKPLRTVMGRTLDLYLWTCNQTLAYRKNAWVMKGKSVSKCETHNLLSDWNEV